MDTLPPITPAAISSEPGPFERIGVLVFDDDPLEPHLFGLGEAAPPTPADAVELWRLGLNRTDAAARAAAAILMRNPSRFAALPERGALADCLQTTLSSVRNGTAAGERHAAALLAALGALAEAQGDLREAERYLHEALSAHSRTDGPDHRDTESAVERIVGFLKRTGRPAEATEFRRARHVERLVREGGSETHVPLRQAAYELFLAGRYAEAEAILRQLLGWDFDVAGTRCHLARLCLLTNREAEARAEIAAAWKNHVGAAKYIELRILFFNALFAVLDGGDGREPLRAIAAGLREPGAHNTWTIQPVIDHLAPQLPAGQRELMAALGHALSDSEKLSELEKRPAWQQVLGAGATTVPPAATTIKGEVPPNETLS